MNSELAAVILTHNNQDQIADCLDSVAWADERVVVDDLSTDGTVGIVREHGATVLSNKMENFAAQRNTALQAVKAQWVLFVDSDERATPALADEVRKVIGFAGTQACAGWWVPRHNFMIGHRMRGGGWFPDHQLRLLKKGRARYDPARPVHEVVILDGPQGYLQSPLIHYNYDTVGQFREKMGRYTEFEAGILYDQGIKAHPWTYVTMPLREFWRRFVSLGGYRDHVYGLLFCGLMAWYTFTTYLRLRQMARQAVG
jgi:glycosyltransferase involved in cell wall biosynthesis